MARLYDANWDDTYLRAGTTRVSEEYFRCDNGYDVVDIQRVDALRVGEQLELDQGHHVVKRIQ